MEDLWDCLHLINYEADYVLEYYIVCKFVATITSEILIEIGRVAERSYLSSFSLLKIRLSLLRVSLQEF